MSLSARKEMEEEGDSSGRKRIKSTPTTRSAEVAAEIKSLKQVVEQLVAENKELKLKVTDSIKSTEFFSQMFDDYKKSNDEVLKKLDEIQKQNSLLMEKNQQLEKKLNDEITERINMEERLYSILNPIEMEKRSNLLELHGIEEKDGENCNAMVKEVLKKITPKSLDVVDCFRIGYKYKRSGEKNSRPMLIKFATKEQSLTAYASRNNLRKIEDQKLYLNQNLPPYLRMLRGKANSLRKEKSYKFIWIRNGIILLRKNEESNVISIQTLNDLNKIV